MSQVRTVRSFCRLYHPFTATVVVSVSAARSPEARERILADRFHRFRCPRCQNVEQVDVPLLYVDPGRRFLALVAGKGRSDDLRPLATEFADELRELAGSDERWRGVQVASLSDLREHLVAAELGLDHAALLRLLEPDDPTLSVGDRARALRARTVRHEGGRTYARRADRSGEWETRVQAGQLRIDGAATWTRASPPAEVAQAEPDAEREGTGDRLAELDVADLDRERLAAGVRALRDLLPRGGRLTKRECSALERLRRAAQERDWDDLAVEAATIVTGLRISPAVLQAVSADDLDGFCEVLLQLPWAEARTNGQLEGLELAPIPGAAAYEWSTGTLYFAPDALRLGEEIRRRLVHEIGHSVHDAHADAVDAWLRDEFGWEMYDVRDDTAIDEWMDDLGGWPEGWDAATRARWREILRDSVVPKGSVDLPGRLLAPRNRPDVRSEPLASELAAAEAQGFRAAPLLRRAQASWFEDPDKWVRHDGKRFALNYYYGGLLVVSDATIEKIAYRAAHAGHRPLGDYAAMSPMEFFAEFYVVMRKKVSGFSLGPLPEERDRDLFFLRVWGRHDRGASDGQPSSWRWAMDRLADSRRDVLAAFVACPEGRSGDRAMR